MSKIRSIKAREVIDSRGNPTVEVELQIDEGTVRSIVPSGASTGKHEALELRDKEDRFLGKGVLKAVENVNLISKKIIGMECATEIDNVMLELDGTENKSKLGANSILAVSMAVCKAGALSKGMPLYQHISEISNVNEFVLPVPCMNIINGGEHAGNKLDIQEYMIIPSSASSFKESVQIGCEVYHTLRGIIKKKYGSNAINVGDEGGFAPPLENAEEPLNLIMDTINELGYDVKIGLDCAASEFYKNGKYNFEGKEFSGRELIDFYKELVKKYPIVSIEDPFDEEDFKNFSEFTKNSKIQVVGDDLLVTNVNRINTAIKKKACNALLLKVNQIGTVTEAINAAKLSFDEKWNVIVSHRSGETEDAFIADLSVGLGCGQIKSGAPCRSERLAKYNQLIRIEEELGEKCRFGL